MLGRGPLSSLPLSGGTFGAPPPDLNLQGYIECSDGVEELLYADELDSEAIYDWNGSTIVVGTEQPVEDLIVCVYPDEPEEIEATDDTFYWATGPPADDNDISFDIYASEEVAEEPDDENYGFFDAPLAPNAPDQIFCVYPDQSEEPEDEDYGLVDYPIGIESTAAPDQIVCVYPEQSEEAEDEDYQFLDWQLPPDNEVAFDQRVYCPDQPEEPEDEDYGFSVAPIVADFVAPDQIFCVYQDEAEEPEEEEDYGFSLAPLAANNELAASCVEYPAQPEEAEDEDFGIAQGQLLLGVIWPSPSQVLIGVKYGPNGDDYTGTLTPGSGSGTHGNTVKSGVFN